jgi:hypothetical protein
MDITNKTKKPLSLPLPGGKKLFLGPGKTGQVTPKALKHPPIVKMLEAGDLETAEGGGFKRPEDASGKSGAPASSPHKDSGAMRQSGDR